MENNVKKLCSKHHKIFTEFVNEKLDNEIEKITAFEFQSLNNPYYREFDADRHEIMLAIYCLLWRDKIEPNANCLFESQIKYSGETFCTTRSAVIYKYGESFLDLTDEKKDKIKQILIDHRVIIDNKLCDKEPHILCNTQLGNFMPLAVITRNSIGEKIKSLNQARATNGLFDYFDLFLTEVKKYYEHGLKSITPTLYTQLEVNQKYFNKFGSFNNYIQANILDDFFIQQMVKIINN